MSSNPAEYWYITKYALSDGIRKLPREQCQLDDKWLWWSQPKETQHRQLFTKSEFYETHAEAQAKAIAMAQKKINSSRKAIAKMEGLIAEWTADQETAGAPQ